MPYQEQNEGSHLTPQKRPKKIPPPVPKKRPKSAPTVGIGNGTVQVDEPNPILSVPKEVLVSCDDLTRLPVLYDDVGMYQRCSLIVRCVAGYSELFKERI